MGSRIGTGRALGRSAGARDIPEMPADETSYVPPGWGSRERSRPRTPTTPAGRSAPGLPPGGLDEDRRGGHVVHGVAEGVAARVADDGLFLAGRNLGDPVHGVYPRGDAPEDGVAAAVVVEPRVVRQVDEELRGGRVGVAGADHGDRAALVAQAVARLILDRLPGGLLHEGPLLLGEATPLDHEAGDDPVEDRVVVEAGIDVFEEVV